MSVPTHMTWGPNQPPEDQIRELELLLDRAFKAEGLPPALVSGMVSRASEIIGGWDWARNQWRIHWTEEALP